MNAGLSPAPARQARAKHRTKLRTLTYVTLDQANGGIVRNLSHEGIAVQAVAALRPRQEVRVRFELRYPRLRVEARGEVTWATVSGQCGIRFLDVSPRMTRQINEWIFGNLLEGASLHSERAGSMFASSALSSPEEDGLMVSAAPLKVIELPVQADPLAHMRDEGDGVEGVAAGIRLALSAALGSHFGLDDQYPGRGGGCAAVSRWFFFLSRVSLHESRWL